MMSDYDGIKLCAKCGEYTLGALCRSCAEQESIDNEYTAGGYDMAMREYDSLHYDPVYGYDDDDDDYDYDDEYVGGFDYYPLTWRERWHYNLTHPRQYLPALWKAIRYKLRYTFDKKYRDSIDEIPF